MGVTFEDMAKKSMRLYWKKTDEYEALSSSKGRKYNKKYFDQMEADTLPEEDRSDKFLAKPPKKKEPIDPPQVRSGVTPNGPIPGENYTSDTKNYPWHRPPEITDLDKAIEASATQLMSEEGSDGLVTMMKAGVDIATLTDMFVTSGIGAGKWTPDFAILLCGPVSHIMYLMAKSYGVDVDLGIDLPKNTKTIAYIDELKGQQKKIDTVMKSLDDPQVVAHIEQSIQGIMGAAQTKTQAEMPSPETQPVSPPATKGMM